MKRLSFFFFLLTASSLFAQVDTAGLKRIYGRAIYFTEEKVDSILYYAKFIDLAATKGQYPEGKVLALHLYGYYYENRADFKKAIDYYLQTLYEARKLGDIEHEVKAMTDLAATYVGDTKQPQKAKEIYLECVALNKKRGDPRSLYSSYTNLGVIYDLLGLHDSAFVFLQEALKIGTPLAAHGHLDMANLNNDLGNNYYFRKEYERALVYFRNNYIYHSAQHNLSAIWTDALNLADCYTEAGRFDSAGKYGDQAMALARQLDSKSKESVSYQILSKLYQHRGDYKKAWEYQRRWYELDTALVNGETYKAVAELEAKYEAREKENEKLVLESEIIQQKFHNRIMMVMALSLLLIAIAAALAFMTKRKVNRKLQATNDLIMRQNERLSELNYEKNSLISIVSHDLSTPFASIGMWNQLLRSGQENLNDEQRKALTRIEQATLYGEKLIRHILDVEKAQTNLHKMQLENLDMNVFAESIIEDFQPLANKKDIQLHLDTPSRSLYFLSDRQLLTRMLENLLSNAIKYTTTGKHVWMSISEEKDAVNIKVRDEGVGIEQDELPHLFAKYSKISSQPTNGEPSTGLGLAIVKRIVEELNGEISCESLPEKGSVFTVVLKK
jgi:signal transduction histidine kinase